MRKWLLKKTKTVFDSKWLKIKANSYELPDGTLAENYYHLDRPDYVLIIANRNDQIILERQYRRGVDEFVYELPAGWVEQGETIEETALRELKEETGHTGKATFLGTIYPQPGFSSMKAHVIKIHLDEERNINNLDEDEEIEFEFVSLEKLNLMIKNNEIRDMGLIAAINLYNQV